MAAITPNINNTIQPGDGSIISVTWNALNNTNNVGAQVQFMPHSDRCVQVEGTFDSATVVLEGSCDNINFRTLRDPGGVALSGNAVYQKQVLEGPLFVRPNSTGGGANQNVAVTLILRRNNPLVK